MKRAGVSVACELRALKLTGGGKGCIIMTSGRRWLSDAAGFELERAAAWLGYGESWQSVANAIADGRFRELLSQAIAFAEEEGP